MQDTAWLAGLLEGEGSFQCGAYKTARGRNLRVSVAMTDMDVIARAAQIMEGTRVYGPYANQRYGKVSKPIYWAVVSGYVAKRVMLRVLPMMGERRSAAIRAAIARWEETPKLRESGLPPTCHPERRHKAKGLCPACYLRSLRAAAAA